MIRALPMHTRTRVGADAGARSASLLLLQAFWVLMVFEVDWFLAGTIGGPWYRIAPLFLPVLGLIVLSRGDRRAVYWPLILFVSLHLFASVLAENAGLSRLALKFMLYMVVLFASSAALLDSPARMITVLKLYLLSFFWFGLQGLSNGRIFWHPLLGNEDSYGPLMVISMAFSYFFGLATAAARWRWIARGIFFVSVLGVVVSFARGAALGAGVVLLHILLRSPNRTKTMMGLFLPTIVLLLVVAIVVPPDAYVAEIASVSEGDDVRMTMWKVAWNVFKESPIYGVGAYNYGVIASMITPFDPTRRVGPDPGQLYFLAVHNAPIQILAEEGLIGIGLWISMIIAVLRWTRRLRTQAASAQWQKQGGGELDLQMVARGLEGAMVGYLATSIFYNQLYIHWFWSLLTISYVLTLLTALRHAPIRENHGVIPPHRHGGGHGEHGNP